MPRFSRSFSRMEVRSLACFCLLAALPALAQTTQPAAPDPGRFANDIRNFHQWDEKNSFPSDAVLFVGSSSTVGWKTHAAFPQWPVINRGFGGSYMTDLNHYFDDVVRPYNARVIVVYEGDNDIEGGRTPEQVSADYATFVSKVRAIQPKTPIILLAIKPSSSRWKVWPQAQAANRLIAELATKEQGVTFVDVATPLLGPDGKPRDELYKGDRLHLKDNGYEIWTKTLEPVLTPLMAARP